jgi:REP element-mobilizing transposase RayT
MRYLWYAIKYLQEMSVVLIAYCLLNTHFHLFLQTLLANLPQFMHRLHSAYARWYNKKRERTGHLFTSRYKASPVQDDIHALELSRYIHLNPVRAGLVSLPEDWRWSSFRHYIGLEQNSVLSTSAVMRQLGSSPETLSEEYRSFVLDGLAQGTAWTEPPLKGGLFLGDDAFAEEISRTYCLSSSKPGLELTPPPTPVSTYEVLEFVLDRSGLGFRTLRESRKHADTEWRNMFLFLSRKLAKTTVKELARFLGLSPGEVSRCVYRFQKKAAADEALLEATNSISQALVSSDDTENVKM